MLGLSVLFVFTCAGLWVGFSSSLQEIVKESAIYLRERLVNLGLSAYLGSKVFTLTGLALVQALLVTVVILLGFQDPTGDLLIPWSIGLWINSFITLFSSFCLGLLVSAMVKNSTQANGALPLLILPQTIFAGVLFKLHDDHLSKILSWLTISRWSIGGYGVILNISEKIISEKIPDEQIKQIYQKSWENLSLNWGMLLLHSVVYLILTFWIQKRKDIFK
jgi:ABC-type multidrug transport system permease subunit